jgi:hypothetical protein
VPRPTKYNHQSHYPYRQALSFPPSRTPENSRRPPQRNRLPPISSRHGERALQLPGLHLPPPALPHHLSPPSFPALSNPSPEHANSRYSSLDSTIRPPSSPPFPSHNTRRRLHHASPLPLCALMLSRNRHLLPPSLHMVLPRGFRPVQPPWPPPRGNPRPRARLRLETRKEHRSLFLTPRSRTRSNTNKRKTLLSLTSPSPSPLSAGNEKLIANSGVSPLPPPSGKTASTARTTFMRTRPPPRQTATLTSRNAICGVSFRRSSRCRNRGAEY